MSSTLVPCSGYLPTIICKARRKQAWVKKLASSPRSSRSLLLLSIAAHSLTAPHLNSPPLGSSVLVCLPSVCGRPKRLISDNPWFLATCHRILHLPREQYATERFFFTLFVWTLHSSLSYPRIQQPEPLSALSPNVGQLL